MELTFIQRCSTALSLANLFFASSCSLEPQILGISIMLKFILRSLQNHGFTQQYFIVVIDNYASQKEGANDVAEDFDHFVMYKENITNTHQ